MASRFDLSVVFKAVDELSGPVRRMENSVIKGAARMERSLRAVTKVSDQLSRSFMAATRTALRFATIGFGALAAGVTFASKSFSKFEDAELGFTPLLGGVENAKKAVSDLSSMAARTPFEFEHLAGATRLLVGLGNVSQKDLIPTLTRLGNLAGGNADQLNRIAIAYSQVKGLGKMDTRDLKQFIDAGAPVMESLLDVMSGMGATRQNFRKDFLEKGLVSAELLDKAITKMTSGSGKFAGTMEQFMKGTTGMMIGLRTEITITAGAIGGALSPVIKEAIKDLTDWTAKVKQATTDEKKMNAVRASAKEIYSAIKSFLKFLTNNIISITKFIAVMTALIVVTKVFIGLLTIFNLLVSISPLGKIVFAVYMLITAMAILWAWWDSFAKSFPIVSSYVLDFVEVIGWMAGGLALAMTAVIAYEAALIAVAFATKAYAFVQGLANAALLAFPGVWIVAAVMAVAVAIGWLIYNWQSLWNAFTESDIGKFVTGIFNTIMSPITFAIDKMKELAQWLGLLDDAEKKTSQYDGITVNGSRNGDTIMGASLDGIPSMESSPTMITPQARISQEINETNSNVAVKIENNSDSTVKVNRTGSSRAGLSLAESGAFQ